MASPSEGLKFQHGLATALAELTVDRLEELQPLTGGRVLDVASGAGVVTDVLRSRGALVTPIDQINYGTPDAIVASAAQLPIQSMSHDGAISLVSISHFPSRTAFFAQVARSLKPGAPFVVADIVLTRDEEIVQTVMIEGGFHIHDITDVSPAVLRAAGARAAALGFDGDLAAFVASHLGAQAHQYGLTQARLAAEAKLHRVGRRMLASATMRYLVISTRRTQLAAG